MHEAAANGNTGLSVSLFIALSCSPAFVAYSAFSNGHTYGGWETRLQNLAT